MTTSARHTHGVVRRKAAEWHALRQEIGPAVEDSQEFRAWIATFADDATKSAPGPETRADETVVPAGSSGCVVATPRAGEQVAIEGDGALSEITTVDVDQVTAWTDGRTELTSAPLRQAVAEMNRYSPVKLELADDRLEDIWISGSFKAGATDSFVHGLESRLEIKAIKVSDSRILLRSSTATK